MRVFLSYRKGQESAAHQLRHGAAEAVLLRSGNAAGKENDHLSEVYPDGRYRKYRLYRPSRYLLRNAGQFLFRRLF